MSSSRPSLPQPRVIYANNHLLAVNKPAGWHSIPLDNNRDSRKCLLSWLKRKSLGGGSRRDFLLPLHRLDQPCTGILLLAKTTKAASRIAKVWKQHQVKKEYTCMLISKSHLDALKRSSRQRQDGWYNLKGFTERSRRAGSIIMMPLLVDNNETSQSEYSPMHSSSSRFRVCVMKWRTTGYIGKNPLIVVQTNEGARHMIRAMLGQVGNAPICGDLRYGASIALPNQSVALHASKVTLPDSLVLPLDQKDFVAPIPHEWKMYFIQKNSSLSA